ncbi:MAG: hypothetical protein MJZ16_04440 [Bacteroidales bacterium]|nr:hypothetical protein [Bacteroidales bacterium]
MRRFFAAIATICLSALLIFSCTKVEPEDVEPQIPVTFTNTAGDWVLSSWRGEDMSGTPVYVRLKDKKFTLWQSVGSMYPVKYTGEYNLYEEDGLGMIIRGMYDYTYEYWAHKYSITSLTKTKMEWTSLDDPTDVSLYERTDSFPEK